MQALATQKKFATELQVWISNSFIQQAIGLRQHQSLTVLRVSALAYALARAEIAWVLGQQLHPSHSFIS